MSHGSSTGIVERFLGFVEPGSSHSSGTWIVLRFGARDGLPFGAADGLPFRLLSSGALRLFVFFAATALQHTRSA
jgi:hypothetical protein